MLTPPVGAGGQQRGVAVARAPPKFRFFAEIAEGVETPAQRDFLENEGCCNFQGYYFGHPGPVEALETFFNPD